MSTHPDKTALLIDPDRTSSSLVKQALEGCCPLIHAHSCEEGRAMALQHLPHIVMINSNSGNDTLSLCRNLRSHEQTADAAIVLISAQDSEEARLQGFDAGADDFISSGFDPKLLATKVGRILKQCDEHARLKAQASWASGAAMSAMTSLSETGMVMEGIKRFNQCDNPEQLARALVDCLAMFELNGAIELLLEDSSIAMNRDGPASELEVSVLHQLASMDRITQFKSRLFIRYPRVRIVVSNLPVADADRCGRLRDHLAMLVEAADIRVNSLLHALQSNARGLVIASTIQTLTGALSGIDMLQRQGRAAATTIRSEVLIRVEQALASLQLTESQEISLLNIVREGLEALADFQLAEAHLQDELSAAIAELQRAASAKAT